MLFRFSLGLIVLGALLGCGHVPQETVEGVLVHRPVYGAENETWVLFELEGLPVELTADPRRPAFRLHGDEQRVSGSGGVNPFAGHYDIDHEVLKFGPLAATKMAGAPAPTELERRFLAVLARVTTWQRHDRALVLFAGATPVARLVVQSEGVAEPWLAPR